MTRARKNAPVIDRAGRELAPVEPNPEPESADAAPAPHDPAPIFPTDEDAQRIAAQLVDDDPSLAHRPHVLARQLGLAIADEATRGKRAADRVPVLETLVAPVFPTDDHVAQLRAAIPTLSDADASAVLNAGHAAFVASIAAGEPITDPGVAAA